MSDTILPASSNQTLGRISVAGLSVAKVLYDFINDEALLGSNVTQEAFWQGFADMHADFAEENRTLLARRDELQNAINAWYRKETTDPGNPEQSEVFLRTIGYLVEEKEDFKVSSTRLDDEVSVLAGPQLVVPASNARYAVNAVNARWGSLYDSLYGTDAVPRESDFSSEKPDHYDPRRGQQVISFVRDFLDSTLPLTTGSHHGVISYAVANGRLAVKLNDGAKTGLRADRQFLGYGGNPEKPGVLLFINNGLRIAIQIDRKQPVGKTDKAGISDVRIESALSVILDLEDSVTAVDASDKVACYRNWNGLVRGDLTARFVRGSKTVDRKLNVNLTYHTPNGSSATIPARALMLVRNVGHLMTTDAVLDAAGNEVFEGQLDALVTAAIGMHDQHPKRDRDYINSSAGSIYIVKPKMHGPEEASFADKICTRVENVLGIEPNTIKLGLMDEERRTTLNLKECIRAIRHRIFFINTGFLDRTGDEIHTSMEAGPVMRKHEIRNASWLIAYEKWNIDIGLSCGMSRNGQLGKGMWAMPDRMAAMLEEKGGQLEAGATTAWVPSPTAATLHALHYHQKDVFTIHETLKSRARAPLHDLLKPSVAEPSWSEDEINNELDNNAQSILGYVVRWIENGVGCSKVPDIHGVALMEDRATLRISSQHIANWLHHGVCTYAQVYERLKRMAAIVDAQNADDPDYRPMASRIIQSCAFSAACDLIFKAQEQPSGYTEPLLHAHRRFAKRQGC